MPTTTGISVVGFQRLILVPDATKSMFLIDLTGSTTSQRSRRVGTVVLSQNAPLNIRQRPVDVYKLYGNGILRSRSESAVQWAVPTELWVNWFFPNISWLARVPD